jgi:hypothetical protein
MEMNPSERLSHSDTPAALLRDTSRTAEEKREILASWVSDAHAVADAPTLRRLATGAVVRVQDVLLALQQLDGGTANRDSPRARRRPRRAAAWLSRTARRGRSDDDDPPPCPASIGVPVAPRLVDARPALPCFGRASHGQPALAGGL